MTTRDRLVIAIGTLVLAALAATFVRLQSAPGDDPRALPTARADRLLDEGALGPLDTLDPLYASSPAERDAAALLFRGLTRPGRSGVEPDVATAWRVDRSGRRYTFTIGADAVWHNGTPVTADDVVFTVRSVQHPSYDGPLHGWWSGVDVERVDDRTVRFNVPAGRPDFLLATTVAITPAAELAGVAVTDRRASGFGRRPIGNGHFRLVALDRTVARLTRVDPPGRADSLPTRLVESTPDPIAGDGGGRAVRDIAIRAYAGTDAIVRAFARGDLDAVGGLSAAERATLGAEGVARVIRYPGTAVTAAFLNLRFDRPEFRDARTRRGLLVAIDREAIVRDVFGGDAAVAPGLVPPGSQLFDPAANVAAPYDPPTAETLLAGAGWSRAGESWVAPGATAPQRLEIATVDEATNPLAALVADAIADDWRAVGLDVGVVALSPTELAVGRLDPRRYDVALLDVDLGHDPDLYPLLVSSQAVEGGTNISAYQSAALDVLLEEAREYAPEDVRRGRLAALQRELGSQLPILPIAVPSYPYVVRNTLLGPAPREVATPQERFWDVLTWRTADGPDR